MPVDLTVDPAPAIGTLVEAELATIATEYREAQSLQRYARGVLAQIEEAVRVVHDIPAYFDLDTALGEQLTFIGRRMGFPRCHCVCDGRPVVGFDCPTGTASVRYGGFCDDAIWQGCGGVSDVCLNDDEVYRAHLYARRYQILGLYDIDSLYAALRHIWGPTAWVPQTQRGRVVIAPGRLLTVDESRALLITLRVLPIAPGVEIAVHFGTARIAGFGQGWAGFCASIPTNPVHGFDCEDEPSGRPIRGFCATDATWVDCAPPVVSEGHWLCPVRIDPYDCDATSTNPGVVALTADRTDFTADSSAIVA